MFVFYLRFACVMIIVGFASITVFVGLLFGIFWHTCRTLEAPTNVIVTNTNNGRLVLLSWLNSEENGHCNVSYKIIYKLNSGKEVEATALEPYYTIIPEVLCFDLFVYVWAISKFGIESDGFAMNYYSSYPINPDYIPVPINSMFSPSDQGLQLTWRKPLELTTCNIYYSIRAESDRVKNYESTVFSENFMLERDWYCFSVDIYITTIIGESRSSEVRRRYVEDLSPPGPLTAHINGIVNSLTFTWQRNVVQYQCGLEYKVIYSLLDSEEEVHRLQDPTITFDMAYCNTVRVVFYTISTYVASPGYVWRYIAGLPERVESVQNIQFNRTTEDEIQVTWDSPLFVESCTDIVYTVTATNVEGTLSTCTGNSECYITLGDFFPYTNFSVEATSRRGTESWEIYKCPTEE